MIGFAGDEDIAELKMLWNEAFSEEEYATLFYDMTFSSVKIITYKSFNKIVSMLHYIPCRLFVNGTQYSGAYLYALATADAYRRQGIMSCLICEAEKTAKSLKSDFLFLIPADNNICGYYKKLGFDYGVKYSITEDNKNMLFDKEIEEYVRRELASEDNTEANHHDSLFLRLNNNPDIPYINGLIPF